MKKITFHCVLGVCDELSDEFEFPDDVTKQEMEQELVQWVLDQVDHWYEENADKKENLISNADKEAENWKTRADALANKLHKPMQVIFDGKAYSIYPAHAQISAEITVIYRTGEDIHAKDTRESRP